MFLLLLIIEDQRKLAKYMLIDLNVIISPKYQNVDFKYVWGVPVVVDNRESEETRKIHVD